MKFVDWVKGWRLVSVIVVVAIGTFVVLRLLDHTTETWNIQNDIAGDLRRQAGLTYDDLTLDCPKTVEWAPNEEFHCIAKTSDGNTTRVTVHMESKDGDYTWAVE